MVIMLSDEGAKVQLARGGPEGEIVGRAVLTYSRAAHFRDIHRLRLGSEEASMTSQWVAGLLGGIVAVVVLVAAVMYGPIGQVGKPTTVQPAQSAPAAPAPRGPVIREVPN